MQIKEKRPLEKQIQRMYQSAGLLHCDEIPVPTMTVSDLDEIALKTYHDISFEEERDGNSFKVIVNYAE